MFTKISKLKFVGLTYFLFSTMFLFACGGGDEGSPIPGPNPEPEPEPTQPTVENVVVVYYTSWTPVGAYPDPNKVTHINYSFGHVNASFDGIRIDQDTKLTALAGLKAKNKSLKILLAIGGWGSGGFSEMARDEVKRKSFATDCKRVLNQYNIDGIDLDWEYPTSSGAGIASHPDDTKNFTLLARDIREAIGEDNLLTMASAGSAAYVDFPAVIKYLDFVNIMGYDYNVVPYHHSALFGGSPISPWMNSSRAVESHLGKGIPAQKLVLGVPFYGRSDMTFSIAYKNIKGNSALASYTEKWDDIAKVPYYADSNGALVFSFDNETSIKLKCEYALFKNLRGIMCWEFNQDNGDLADVIYKTIIKKE